MRVFISWSGNRSRMVAELLRDWIRCVLQATRPWISSRDLDRGAVWFTEINDQLKDAAIGIICLTGENRNKPWILFEAGALAKGLNSNRVCTFLVDVQPTDIEDPLAQFNHTSPNSSEMFGLIETINNALGAQALDPRILQQVFDTYWPQFEASFRDVLSKYPPEAKVEQRDERDLLSEILATTRALSGHVAMLNAERVSVVSPETREPDSRRSGLWARTRARRGLHEGLSPSQIFEQLVKEGVSREVADEALTRVLRSIQQGRSASTTAS